MVIFLFDKVNLHGLFTLYSKFEVKWMKIERAIAPQPPEAPKFLKSFSQVFSL